ncbi:MAG TPA: phage holin family protein [Allosphingosinicella sp.]|nr:phage holin family protein [Allosphingosinicella sp.]
MDAPGEEPREDSIGELVGRLIEDGRSYAEAELELLRAIAEYRAQRARKALVLLAAGAFLLVSAITALVIGAVEEAALNMHPILAGLLVAAAMAGAGYLLVRLGLAGLKTLGRDEAERAALDKGEAR